MKLYFKIFSIVLIGFAFVLGFVYTFSFLFRQLFGERVGTLLGAMIGCIALVSLFITFLLKGNR